MGISTDRTEITVAEKKELDETLDVLKTINEDNAQCDNNGAASASVKGDEDKRSIETIEESWCSPILTSMFINIRQYSQNIHYAVTSPPNIFWNPR